MGEKQSSELAHVVQLVSVPPRLAERLMNRARRQRIAVESGSACGPTLTRPSLPQAPSLCGGGYRIICRKCTDANPKLGSSGGARDLLEKMVETGLIALIWLSFGSRPVSIHCRSERAATRPRGGRPLRFRPTGKRKPHPILADTVQLTQRDRRGGEDSGPGDHRTSTKPASGAALGNTALLRLVGIPPNSLEILAREQSFVAAQILQAAEEPLRHLHHQLTLLSNRRLTKVSGLSLHLRGPAQQRARVRGEGVNRAQTAWPRNTEVRHRAAVPHRAPPQDRVPFAPGPACWGP